VQSPHNFASVATLPRAEFCNDAWLCKIDLFSNAPNESARTGNDGSDLHGTLKKSLEKECAHTEADKKRGR